MLAIDYDVERANKKESESESKCKHSPQKPHGNQFTSHFSNPFCYKNNDSNVLCVHLLWAREKLVVLSSEILNNKIAITIVAAGDCAHAPIDYSIEVCLCACMW